MGRVAAVAQVHRRLYTSHDLKSVLLNQYLEALLEDLRRSAEGNKMSRLTLKAEPIEIDPDRAVAIGIIVNELVMNAVKYAYPDGAGPIHVVLNAHGDDLELSIADDGVGLNVKTDPRSTGMGQRIVTAMAQKLDASVERDPAHAGTRIVLRFRRVNAPAPAQARERGGVESVPRTQRSAHASMRMLSQSRGPSSNASVDRVPALRSGMKNAAPRPGHGTAHPISRSHGITITSRPTK